MEWIKTANPIIFKEQFYIYRDTSLLNWDYIQSLIDVSDQLNELFIHTDPDRIAELLLLGYNTIIDTLTPKVRKHIKKKPDFRRSPKTINLFTKIQTQFHIAKTANSNGEWRL